MLCIFNEDVSNASFIDVIKDTHTHRPFCLSSWSSVLCGCYLSHCRHSREIEDPEVFIILAGRNVRHIMEQIVRL